MILVGNAVHQSGADPSHPIWDTMLGVRNLATVPLNISVRIYRDDGSVVKWGSDDSYNYVLEAEQAIAQSFIPNNGLGPNPPFDWAGTIQVTATDVTSGADMSSNLITWAMGAYDCWKHGVEFPTFNTEAANKPVVPNTWSFAYAIPFFDDLNGATKQIWQTGVLIKNWDMNNYTGKLVYKVNQAYAQKGQIFTTPFSLGPNQSIRFYLNDGNAGAGIPGFNTTFPHEGAFDVIIDQPGANIQPTVIVFGMDANKSWTGWMVAQQYK